MESQQTKRFSLSDMLDTVMFLVEEDKADESQIPTLNKDRLLALMSFASVDHYRVRETHVKFNVPPLYALPCYYFADETASEWKNDETDSDWKNNKVTMMADAISSYQACKDEETHVKLNGPSSYALPCYFGDKTARVKLNVPSSYALPCYFGDKTAREWKNDETEANPDTSTYRAAVFGENGEEEHWRRMDADIEVPTKRQTWEAFGENDEEYWRRMITMDERLERENCRQQQAITLLRETNLRPAHQNHDIGDAIEKENTEAQAMSQFQPQTVLETPRQVQFGRNRTVVIDDSLTTNRATRLPMPILQTPVETPVPRTTAIEHEDRQVMPEQALTGRRTIRQRTPNVRQDPDDFLDENASQWKINEVAMMADTISSYQVWKDEDLTEIYGLLAELDADQTAQFFQPQAYVSKKVSDPDTPTYREAVFGENHQVVLSSSDTMQSKVFFEKTASEYHWSLTCEEVNIWMVGTQSRGSVTRSSSGDLTTSNKLRVNWINRLYDAIMQTDLGRSFEQNDFGLIVDVWMVDTQSRGSVTRSSSGDLTTSGGRHSVERECYEIKLGALKCYEIRFRALTMSKSLRVTRIYLVYLAIVRN